MATTVEQAINVTIAARQGLKVISKDDAAWILSNAFLILTMQTGFGLLEAGCAASKNIANIMVKNVVDVTLGGVSYWAVGYGLSFGRPSNWFCGMGNFFLHAEHWNVSDERDPAFGPEGTLGYVYTHYVFQFSFATAGTTIVSGAVAERMRLTAYMFFSVFNTFVYCLPASWCWNATGFLKQWNFFDFAGGGVVHATGGATSLVAAAVLGPRLGRFGNVDYSLSSPVTALTGTFMLWWAWLGFNCGSSFGIDGHLWIIAAKVGVITLNGSIGGSLVGMIVSAFVTRGHYEIDYLINGVLGGLVGVTAACAVISPTEAYIVGIIGAGMALGGKKLLDYVKIDDPVGAAPVHLFGGGWGVLAVGIFGRDDFGLLNGRNGLLHGGGFHQLWVQSLGLLIMCLWSMSFTAIIFFALRFCKQLRLTMADEIAGADLTEHGIKSIKMVEKLETALRELGYDDQLIDNAFHKILKTATGNVDTAPPPNEAPEESSRWAPLSQQETTNSARLRRLATNRQSVISTISLGVATTTAADSGDAAMLSSSSSSVHDAIVHVNGGKTVRFDSGDRNQLLRKKKHRKRKKKLDDEGL